MNEIRLAKRVKYAGDIHTELLKSGWDLESATTFVNNIPDADVAPVVRCRDCRYCDPSNGAFWCDRFDSAVQIDGMAYCSYGKRKLKEEITNERVD